ncbi:MAG: hypothetical protein MUP98_08590 [Candidatus Aminicenantes bacterium]|nr:hypothetical protein [Candidatus Aminicenantes bacterium]
MKCKDIEHLVIASSGGLSDSKQLDVVRSHVELCDKCLHLKEDVESLRSLLNRRVEPVLPEDLDKKTYQLCKSEIHSLQKNSQRVNFRQHMQAIPIYMKVVFIALLVIMSIWFFFLFEDFGSGGGESLSMAMIFGLFLIIQNAMMLLFSPLLISRFRSKKIQHTIYSIGG